MLQNIILHIQQDAAEKVEEIEVKSEEEFRQEKNREILISITKIDNDYNYKENRAQRSTLVYKSKIMSTSRLELLSNKYYHVSDTIRRARERFSNKDQIRHLGAHKEILRALIMQGLCKLMEPIVFIKSRLQDKDMLKELLWPIEKDYEEGTGLPVGLYLDENHHLPIESEGGVILCSQDHTVTLDNTLSSRLDMITHYILPQINQMLYGKEKINRNAVYSKRFHSYLPTVDETKNRIEIKLKHHEGINIEKLSIGQRSIYEQEPQRYLETVDQGDDISLGSLFSEKGKNN